MFRWITSLCFVAVLAAPLSAEDREPPKKFKGLPLVFFDGFEGGKADDWQPTDPEAWRIMRPGEEGEAKHNFVYDQFRRRSKFEPPVRSPYNRSLRKDVVVGSFVLDVDLKSTVEDYGHRSLCLFFGYQDDAHLYYVHFGKQADDHANQIFIVNEAARRKISTKTTEGTPWDDEWHHARIVRDVKKGTIEVYFDDMEKPVMLAVDKTFTHGRVGVGSFDDSGWFDNITLWGDVAE